MGAFKLVVCYWYLDITRRGTVVTRWICFVQAPGSTPGGEAHPIFPLREASRVSKEADGNPLAY